MSDRSVIEIVRTMVEDGKSLVLRRNKGALELVLGNVVLLSSAALETEVAFGRLASTVLSSHFFARAACGPPPALRDANATPQPRIIIGGLGFGATLRGVLDVAPSDAEVIVVEKLRTVIEVARDEAADLVGKALDDPRVVLRQTDVADVMNEMPSASVSAILLDVDNGPEWASFRTNARLYSDAALLQARATLIPGGIFAVWSGYPADAFVRTLRRAGFVPRIELLYERAHSDGKRRGVVRARAYVGTKPSANER